MYQAFFKRLMDIICAFCALCMLAPLLGAIALLVRRKLGTPVIFTQVRPGLRAMPFTLYKFRTMTSERDEMGNLLPDAERLTKLGGFLRSSSIDELPELWNVLKGSMSLVGPRPLLSEYLPYYSKREKKRHSVRPGITGLAQIKGRNYLMWDKRLELDVQYVESMSFLKDLMIIIKTVQQVLVRKNVAVIPSAIGQPLSVCRSHLYKNKLKSNQITTVRKHEVAK